jgi:hypothetical protein
MNTEAKESILEEVKGNVATMKLRYHLPLNVSIQSTLTSIAIPAMA